MKTALLALALVLAPLVPVVAQGRMVTLVLDNPPSPPQITTNEFSISAYETAELKAYGTAPSCYPPALFAKKEGKLIPLPLTCYNAGNGGLFPRHLISGPATVVAHAIAWGTPNYITFEIRPEGFDPNKTLIIPPGTNQVAVALECSSNLVHWVSATNGVYGSETEAKFFRIRADRVQ